jgi:hypothetical protein
MPSRHVRRDMTVPLGPKRMPIRQRFGIGHIQPGGRQATRAQRLQQRILVDRRSAPDVVEHRTRPHRAEPVRVEKVDRLSAVRQNVDDMVSLVRKHPCQVHQREDWHPFVTSGLAPISQQPHPQGCQELSQPPPNRSIPHDHGRCTLQRSAGIPQRIPLRSAVGSNRLQ